MPSPPASPHDEEDQKFSCYFEELLDIPWDEYLAMDEELELEQLLQAPNVQAYSTEDQDQDREQDETCPEVPPTSHTDALEFLMNIQKSNLNDTKLFDLLEQAMNHIQNKKTQTELNSKNIQSSLLKFFPKC